MIVNAIVAVGNQGQIGLNGLLPWYDAEDLKWFKELTLGKVLVCGYNTLTTLPPLPDRFIVQDDQLELPERMLESLGVNEVWIIGGAKTYRRYAHLVDRWHIGKINYSGSADAFFDFSLISMSKAKS